MAEYEKRPIIPLETPRLWLRPLERGDAPRIQELFLNEAVLRYLHASCPYPYPPNGANEFLDRILPSIEAQEEYAWAMLLKDRLELRLIGQISLNPSSDRDSRGFWLGEAYWSNGYMGEAVVAVQDFAFDILKMKELLLNNAELNVASHRLKERMGAEIIGKEPKEYISGTFTSVRWRLTAEAWAKHREDL